MSILTNNTKALILVGIALFLTGGCSIIGYSIGSAVDSRKSDYKLISGGYYTQVRPGKVVTIIRRDGSELRGAFLGVSSATDSSYEQMLNSADTATPLDLPTMRDKVYLRFESGTADEAEFHGFDYKSPSLVLTPAVLLKFPGHDTVTAVSLSAIHELSTLEGTIISTENLMTGIAQGSIPSRTVLEIDTGAVKTLRIAPEDLRSDTTLYRQLHETKPRLISVVTRSDSLISCENRQSYWNVASESVCFTTDQGRHHCELLGGLKFIDIELPGDSTLPGEISLSTVGAIRVTQSRHAATTGFVVGLGLDLTLMIVGFAMSSAMEMNMSFGG